MSMPSPETPTPASDAASVPIAVAMHVYNRSAVIGEALRSILAQTVRPAEIVVLDDGSTDDTAEVAAAVSPRVRVIRTPNQGIGLARDAAIRACSAPWVALCDSDDHWLPEHLEHLAEGIAAHPDAGMVFTNFREVGPRARNPDKFASAPPGWWEAAGQRVSTHHRRLSAPAFPHLLVNNPVFPSAWAVRRDVYEEVGSVPPELSRTLSQDAHTTRRISLVAALIADDRISVEIDKSGGGVSSNALPTTLGRIRILESYLASDWLPPEHRHAVVRRLEQDCSRALSMAFWQRDFATVRRMERRLGHRSLPRPLRLRALLARLPSPMLRVVLGRSMA